MPEIDGYQVLETMQQDSLLHSIPVIVISSIDDDEGIQRALALGARGYLPKSFDASGLKAQIAPYLDKIEPLAQ